MTKRQQRRNRYRRTGAVITTEQAEPSIIPQGVLKQVAKKLQKNGQEQTAASLMNAAAEGNISAAAGDSGTVISQEASADPEDPEVGGTPSPAPAAAPSVDLQSLTALFAQTQQQMQEQMTRQEQRDREYQERIERLTEQLGQAQQQQSQTDEQLQQTQSELEQSQQRNTDLDRLEQMLRLQGRANFDTEEGGSARSQRYGGTGFNTMTNPMRSHPQGLAKEFFDAMHSSESKSTIHYHEETGTTRHRDPRPMHRVIQAARREAAWGGSNPLVQATDEFFRAHGLFATNGLQATLHAAGPTLGTDDSIGSLYLDTVSTFMRSDSRFQGILHAFTEEVYNPTTSIGQGVRVYRKHRNPPPRTEEAYVLGDSASYNSPAISIGTQQDSQSLRVSYRMILNKLYGLGKGDDPETQVYFLPEFHRLQSFWEMLQMMIASNLWTTYLDLEEFILRIRYETTQFLLYRDGNAFTENPLDLTVGDGGTMTGDLLEEGVTRLAQLGTPAFADGHYVAVLPTRPLQQLASNLRREKLWQATTPEEIEQLTNMLQARLPTTSLDRLQVANAYRGKYFNANIFHGPSLGIPDQPTAHPIPTSQMITTGAGLKHFYGSLLFGEGCVGRGISMDFTIRPSGVNLYGLGQAWNFLTIQGTGTLDTYEGNGNGERTRCLMLMTSAKEM